MGKDIRAAKPRVQAIYQVMVDVLALDQQQALAMAERQERYRDLLEEQACLSQELCEAYTAFIASIGKASSEAEYYEAGSELDRARDEAAENYDLLRGEIEKDFPQILAREELLGINTLEELSATAYAAAYDALYDDSFDEALLVFRKAAMAAHENSKLIYLGLDG